MMLLVSDLYKVNHRTVIPPIYFDRKRVIPLIKNDNITIDEHFDEIKNQSRCISDLTINYFLYCLKRTKQFVNAKLYEMMLDMRVEGKLSMCKGTPKGKGTGLAYLNEIMNGSPSLTQRDIAETMHIAESSLRKNYKELEKELQNFANGGSK